MSLSWKDAVTTASAAAAVVLERAYYHAWDWPLVSNSRWVITGLALMILVGIVFSYLLDQSKSSWWPAAATIFSLATIFLTGFGLIFAASDYVVLLMLTAVLFWLTSIVRHLTASDSMRHAPV